MSEDAHDYTDLEYWMPPLYDMTDKQMADIFNYTEYSDFDELIEGFEIDGKEVPPKILKRAKQFESLRLGSYGDGDPASGFTCLSVMTDKHSKQSVIIQSDHMSYTHWVISRIPNQRVSTLWPYVEDFFCCTHGKDELWESFFLYAGGCCLGSKPLQNRFKKLIEQILEQAPDDCWLKETTAEQWIARGQV